MKESININIAKDTPSTAVAELRWDAKLMKFLLCLALISLVNSLPLPAQEGDTDELLKSGAATIHKIWTDWMEKPELKYTKISKDFLPQIHGTWTGSYVEDDEKVILRVVLRSDGTWISEVFRPDIKNGHWYLSDGMILLFESMISDDADLASALLFSKNKLRLLCADVEAGFVELIKAEQTGATNPAKPGD